MNLEDLNREQGRFGGCVGPVAPSERIHRVDVLRGFALAGVCLVNVFESGTIAPGAEQSVIGNAVNFLAEGSFYPLFSLLFGLGFALQMARFKGGGGSFVRYYIQRSMALVAIGVASFVFILGNPILIRYGILALFLLLFVKASGRTILIASACTLLIVLGQGAARQAWRDHARSDPTTAATLARRESVTRADAAQVGALTTRALTEGTYGDIVAARWLNVQRLLRNPWFHAGSRNLSMFMLFLLGMFIARIGLVTSPTVDRAVLLRMALVGFGIGIAGNIVLLGLPTWLRGRDAFVQLWTNDVTYYIANPALGLAYGALLMRVRETSIWSRPVRQLAWAGRMALTNFLLQFVFLLGLFYLKRAHVIEHTSAAMAVVLSAVVFAMQVVLSRWWLSRFRYGPAEWLWRVLTFGRLRRTNDVQLADIPA
jgi:uncharacterized protein